MNDVVILRPTTQAPAATVTVETKRHTIAASTTAAVAADSTQGGRGYSFGSVQPTVIPAGTSLDAWVRAAGLDWKAEKATVEYITSGGEKRRASHHAVVYRNDTGEPIGVNTSRYHVHQPAEVMEFYRGLLDHWGYQMEGAGTINGGSRIWALAKTGHELDLGGGDLVQGRVMFVTAFDGSSSTIARFTTLRLGCWNMLNAIATGGRRSAHDAVMKIPHSTILDTTKIAERLGFSGIWADTENVLKRLAQTPITNDLRSRFFGAIAANVADLVAMTPERMDKVRRSVNQFEAAYAEQPGTNYDSMDGTVWGALNAVTYHIDHARTARGGERWNTVVAGQGERTKARAFQLAMKIAA